MSFKSSSKPATIDSLPPDSVCFDYETALKIGKDLALLKKLKAEVVEHRISIASLQSAVQVSESRLEISEKEKQEYMLQVTEVKLSESSCQTEVDYWMEEANKKGNGQIWVGALGLVSTVLSAIFIK